jgi:hypothetical protein
MVNVFISYSHRDDELRAELETHLSLLKRQGIVRTWYDREIGAGEEIDSRVSAELEKADIILLLVSPYFLASDYCYEIEMQRAMERHREGTARVIPVILHPCDWQHAPFKGLKAVPDDGKPVSSFPNRHDAFLQITRAIREAATALRPEPQDRGTAPAPAKERSARAQGIGATRPNVRIRKQFTDRDRDAFIEEAFAHIAEHFETSLRAVESENPEVEARFKRRGDSAFTATVYVRGATAAECKVWYGARGGFDHGIAFSYSVASENSFNEQLLVEDDGYELRLKPLGMATFSGATGPMTKEEAADYYWRLFIERLK